MDDLRRLMHRLQAVLRGASGAGRCSVPLGLHGCVVAGYKEASRFAFAGPDGENAWLSLYDTGDAAGLCLALDAVCAMLVTFKIAPSKNNLKRTIMTDAKNCSGLSNIESLIPTTSLLFTLTCFRASGACSSDNDLKARVSCVLDHLTNCIGFGRREIPTHHSLSESGEREDFAKGVKLGLLYTVVNPRQLLPAQFINLLGEGALAFVYRILRIRSSLDEVASVDVRANIDKHVQEVGRPKKLVLDYRFAGSLTMYRLKQDLTSQHNTVRVFILPPFPSDSSQLGPGQYRAQQEIEVPIARTILWQTLRGLQAMSLLLKRPVMCTAGDGPPLQVHLRAHVIQSTDALSKQMSDMLFEELSSESSFGGETVKMSDEHLPEAHARNPPFPRIIIFSPSATCWWAFDLHTRFIRTTFGPNKLACLLFDVMTRILRPHMAMPLPSNVIVSPGPTNVLAPVMYKILNKSNFP